MTSTEAGNYELASYEYGENNGKLKKITYSNGLVVEYSYNTLEKLENVWYTKSGTWTYNFDADLRLYVLGTRYYDPATGRIPSLTILSNLSNWR